MNKMVEKLDFRHDFYIEKLNNFLLILKFLAQIQA